MTNIADRIAVVIILLFGMGAVVMVATQPMGAMPDGRSGVLRTEPSSTVSALRAPATIAKGEK